MYFLYTHCTENPIYVFPEINLCSLVPNSYIQVFVSDLYIPRIGLPIWLQQNNADGSWEYINCSQIHECGNWKTEHYNSVWEKTQFHFWEYINRNQTFIVDYCLGLGLSPLPGLLRPSHLPPAGYQVHFT